jgi:uncharacterized protein (DUF608 family)
VAVAGPWQLTAGLFTREDFKKLVPEDKRLLPGWIRSLTERGEPAVYRGKDLDLIGMPVGGLCAGQVYLGGDGRLWHWDIFNQHIGTGADHYARPLKPGSPLEQGFAVRLTQGDRVETRMLARDHWADVSFTAQYPIGGIRYADPALPLIVGLEAFSPFIPLNTEDSSLPATILEFTLHNTSDKALQVELGGWLENAVGLRSAETSDGVRRNRLLRTREALLLECSAAAPPAKAESDRPDLVFDDFEREDYKNWTVTGTAFGQGPVDQSKIPEYQGQLGGAGKRVVNSHASAPGNNVGERDAATGTLTSRAFTIERNYITFLIGGGPHKARTCVNLLIDGKVELSETGPESNVMRPLTWPVHKWAGRSAQIQVVDAESGGWGNIGIDDIVFSDRPRSPLRSLAEAPDFGTMSLGLLKPKRNDFGSPRVPRDAVPTGVFAIGGNETKAAECLLSEKLLGSLTHRLRIGAGKTAKATFVLSWHFPNLEIQKLPRGRFYAQRFVSASDVVRYVSTNYDRLTQETRLWRDTWYDSTLPFWFLDRTFLNTSILATSTCYRLGKGRFYAWEGVGCCEGTCGHVWQYAHAAARLFPELERGVREQVDFGLALQPDGAIHFRGEFNNIPAIDAQAGTVLRALREHQMSCSDAFLKRNWPGIKLATKWLIGKDTNGDGIIEGNQHNTLDTDWFGPVAWLSGMYLAALRATEVMAREVGDTEFAQQCQRIAEAGRDNLVRELFDNDYFINKPDPKRLDAINSGSGCHIDQVFGQSWAFQVGLPRILPEKETLSALKSLWRFNFTPDVGPYRETYKPGRWYAMAGEAGLLMCTFPKSDWDYAQAKGKGPEWAAGYFNECMNGFEYQVAGHMIWEGMLTEGLAITRAVHDRYHPSRRNPFNEVECGDHYARSMASYGVFLAACGFYYHGPHGVMRFHPRIDLQDFRCAFTSAEGWGTFEQRLTPHPTAKLQIKWGRLALKTLELGALPAGTPKVSLNGKRIRAVAAGKDHLVLEFAETLSITRGDVLTVTC